MDNGLVLYRCSCVGSNFIVEKFKNLNELTVSTDILGLDGFEMYTLATDRECAKKYFESAVRDYDRGN